MKFQWIFRFFSLSIFIFRKTTNCRVVEKRGAGERLEPPFPGAKIISSTLKSENLKFLHVNNMWDVIYWTRQKWQKVDRSLWIFRFSNKLSYHSYQQQVCKFLFLIRILVKTNSNLMCGSLQLIYDHSPNNCSQKNI